MSNLTLYGTIAMALLSGLFLALIAAALLDHGDTSPNDDLLRSMLQDQRSRQSDLRAWPTAPHSRGEGVTVDTQKPGRHRALDAALDMTAPQRPSLVNASLSEALAWLATDRVKREAEHTAFKQLLSTSRFRSTIAPRLLAGR